MIAYHLSTIVFQTNIILIMLLKIKHMGITSIVNQIGPLHLACWTLTLEQKEGSVTILTLVDINPGATMIGQTCTDETSLDVNIP